MREHRPLAGQGAAIEAGDTRLTDFVQTVSLTPIRRAPFLTWFYNKEKCVRFFPCLPKIVHDEVKRAQKKEKR